MFNFRKCWEKTSGQKALKRVLTCLPSYLDAWWRWKDFRVHRSYGGLPRKFINADGHSPLAFMLPTAVSIFLIYGPTLGWRGPAALILLMLALGFLFLGARLLDAKYFMEFQWAYLAGLSLLLWAWTPPGALESDPRIYRHLLIPLFPFLILVPLMLAKILAWRLFRKPRRHDTLRHLLPHVELFSDSPELPEISTGMIWRSFINAPLRYPLHLVFLPAVLILFLPYYLNIYFWSAVFLAATWIILWFASIHDRFNAVLPLIHRAFFIGGQLVISIAVIALAAGRLAGVSYIQTVVESSSWRTLLSYVTCAYVTFWFFEYWLNRMLCEELVGMLQRPGDPVGQASYDLDPRAAISKVGQAEPNGRVIQIHGGGRLIVIGRRKKASGEVFETFERKALFQRLTERFAWQEGTKDRVRLEAARKLAAQSSRYSRYYFSFVNLFLIATFVTAGFSLTRLPQQPVLTAVTDRAESGVDLTELILGGPPRNRVILLAASGGGTRAALYTQSVLRGLNAMDVLNNLVLVSGVSGGGAALAYYAAHQSELMGKDTEDAWAAFSCAMSHPFIWDVLEGASEWRMVTGSRSGQLLAESFERVFGCGTEANSRIDPKSARSIRSDACTLGDIRNVAVIFNTAIAGHLFCPQCRQQTDFPRAARKNRAATRGAMAGGRLVFTNIKNGFKFPPDDMSLRLPYVAVRDPEIPLTTAAALNANFPPIFSNAAVDVDRQNRYWVTDGGAVENRGMISLLLALRATLVSTQVAGRRPVPDIHIIMAEASAGTKKYIQDRGIGSKFGAPAKIANQLIRELLNHIARSYQGRIYYHTLAMPEFLRIDGGLGTHWMLPRNVEMRSPENAGSSSDLETQILDAIAVRHIINGLHRQNQTERIGVCADEGIHPVWESLFVEPNREKSLAVIYRWLAADSHRNTWQCLQSALTDGDCPAARVFADK